MKLYMVEDNAYVRRSLHLFFQVQPEWQACGIVTTAEAAMADLAANDVDLVLVGIVLPGMDGIQLSKRLRTQAPALRCLVFTCY